MGFYCNLNKVVFIFFAMLVVVSCCAHPKKAKKNKMMDEAGLDIKSKSDTALFDIGTHAFFIEVMPGNIPVDENGKELAGSRSHIYYTIYIETNEKEIKWEKATSDGGTFTINGSLVTEPQIEAGRDLLNQSPVIIKKSTGKFLWQLSLDPVANDKRPNQRPTNKGFILSGSVNGKVFKKATPVPVQLFTHPSV